MAYVRGWAAIWGSEILEGQQALKLEEQEVLVSWGAGVDIVDQDSILQASILSALRMMHALDGTKEDLPVQCSGRIHF